MAKTRAKAKAPQGKKPSELQVQLQRAAELRRLDRTLREIDRARRRVLSGLVRQERELVNFATAAAQYTDMRLVRADALNKGSDRIRVLEREVEARGKVIDELRAHLQERDRVGA